MTPLVAVEAVVDPIAIVVAVVMLVFTLLVVPATEHQRRQAQDNQLEP